MPDNDSNGWRESADAWIEFVRVGDTNRTYLLDPVMLSLCGAVEGKRVLDVGCGEGRFSRMMAKRGATAIGIDPTPELISVAKKEHPSGQYLLGNAEDLAFGANVFDLVISYLTLIDIPRYREGIAEMARVLKPTGQLVIANLHPTFTAGSSGWTKDSKGNRLHFPIDSYYEERGERVGWCGINVVNWHRSMEDYFAALLDSGLVLRKYLEPRPTKQALQYAPNLRDCLRIPTFNVMLWEKS